MTKEACLSSVPRLCHLCYSTLSKFRWVDYFLLAA